MDQNKLERISVYCSEYDPVQHYQLFKDIDVGSLIAR